ncbi:BadF/BadG/BcrA/BcrD ATPase family protein [Bacillus cytotoxicus]|uniref:BadF/BadG/BcrA/BcrD ATPase family protein n=1 Tax=Bacillus cytotoxicus TaxID=580165 RepID=UPI00244BEFE1|nr:BadF/BadG/BcrA/BcrD ATPase family protein [Bacillus cytotoxicus]MDH2880356.1 ATPase [Bacillus cytotoxicus]
MKYIIGVDGGGTKTEAIAFDKNGKEIARGMSCFGNVLLDYERAISHICEAIDQCFQRLCKTECACIGIGLAGVNSIDIHTLKERFITKYQTEIEIYNDAIIAHAALLEGNDGILTIAGTGAVCLGKKGERYEYSGGWGHILGDEGSGYWIALQALKRMTRAYDKGISFCKLGKVIQEKCHIVTPEDIKQLIYSKPKDHVASIAPIVVEAAKQGNTDAFQIIIRAGEELANITNYMYKRMLFEEPISIAVKGGILNSVPEIYAHFKTNCEKNIQEKIHFIQNDVSSAKGVYMLMAEKEDIW